MFKLTFLGHAGWIIKNKDFKVLCDPWLNTHGSYFGEWHQFPPNHHLFTSELFDDLDFIYISHGHEDHYDEWLLRQTPKNIPILIPNFYDKTLLNNLKKIGFTSIQELKRKDNKSFKNISVKIIEEDGHLDADSALLLDDGTHKVLNLNDCHVDFCKLKDITGDIDLLLLQSSSAIWWPCSYNYDVERKKKLGIIKRANLLKRTLEYCKVLNAKNVIPNAGPPVFISEHLDMWNYNRREEYNPFMLMDDACKFLQDKGINSHLVIPGTTFSLEGKGHVDTTKEEFAEIYDDYESYLEKYLFSLRNNKQEQDSINTSDLPKKLKKQFKKLKRASKFYVDKIDFPVLFDLDYEGKWILNFSNKNHFTKFERQDYNYRFSLDPKSVSRVLTGDVYDFENYFLSCNFECSREPDEYNEFLFALLKHFDVDRLNISEQQYAKRSNILDETFELNHNGITYEVQKYCPHMLANLEKTGFVDDEERLVCPLHGWKFSLKNGKCKDNQGFCLKVREK
jgi:UDP-MurNAc hydroxylase